MADESLKDPITVTAVGINAASLPVVFSPAYRMYCPVSVTGLHQSDRESK